MNDPQAPRRHWLRWLLAVPVLAMLWVPSYNVIEPSLVGVPFFYWYQLLWVMLGSVVVGLVYLVEHR